MSALNRNRALALLVTIKATGLLSVPSYILGGAPSPSVLNLHSDRTLTDTYGNTIALRCNEITHDFTNPATLPITGNCTVISGTGAYAGLHGQGKMAGTGDATGPTMFVLAESLQLSTQ